MLWVDPAPSGRLVAIAVQCTPQTPESVRSLEVGVFSKRFFGVFSKRLFSGLSLMPHSAAVDNLAITRTTINFFCD